MTKNEDEFDPSTCYFDKLSTSSGQAKLTNRDQNFIAFCNDLRAYIEEHKMFPDKRTQLSYKIKYTRKKINEGTLEDWNRMMFEEIANSRDLSILTGGRRKKK